jgi:rSAM/selenodomain-associated transferase 2
MISVLIPTKNEEFHLPLLLKRLQLMPEISEIIVSDGGSTDSTTTIASRMGAEVVSGAIGRGPQLNLAASKASSEILWFLHGDCLPSKGCGAQIMGASVKGIIGGNFRIQFRSRGVYPRLFEAIARIQRGMGIYYGDSGIWVERKVFHELGGFADWPLFEDYDFARRLESFSTTQCLAGRLQVSARRFEKEPLKILILWLELQLRFQCGQSPQQLAQLYREKSA